MKDSTYEIAQLNSLYLKETAKEYFKGSKSACPTEEGVTLPNIRAESAHNYSPRNKKPINFVYINDNYRRQINKAFMTFNPFTHLTNLNMLKKENSEVKQ